MKLSSDKKFCFVFNYEPINIIRLDLKAAILLNLCNGKENSELKLSYYSAFEITSPTRDDEQGFDEQIKILTQYSLIN